MLVKAAARAAAEEAAVLGEMAALEVAEETVESTERQEQRVAVLQPILVQAVVVREPAAMEALAVVAAQSVATVAVDS